MTLIIASLPSTICMLASLLPFLDTHNTIQKNLMVWLKWQKWRMLKIRMLKNKDL